MTFQRGTQWGQTSEPAADWRDRGACQNLGAGADVFYPAEGGSVAEAKRICARCDVRPECLEYALDREGDLSACSRHGVWGGMSTREREQTARCRSGRCPHPEHLQDDDYGQLVATVRELAGQGLKDREIGRRVGRTTERVYELRRTHGIAAGYWQRGKRDGSPT